MQDSPTTRSFFETSFTSQSTPLYDSDIFSRDYDSNESYRISSYLPSKNYGSTTTGSDQHHGHYQNHEPRNTLRRNMKFRHGFAFVVGCIVGAGIFISSSLVARRTPNMFLALVAWILAGGLALLGALCYCEMVSVVRKTGASYVFVLDCYGKAAGFVVNWTNAMIFAPCNVSILTVTIGLYTCVPFFKDTTSPEYIWCSKFVGLAIMTIIVAINCLGARKSGVFQIAFITIQMIVFLMIVCLGIYSAATTKSIHNLSPNVVFNNTLEGFTEDFPSFGIALFNALYSFDGYTTNAYIIEEIENPAYNIPFITLTSIPFITFIYIVINLACGAALTHSEIASSNIVVATLTKKVGGNFLVYFVPFCVAMSIVPTLSAVFYNLPRVVMSSAREGQFPSLFSLIHKDRRTPILAIIFLGFTTNILIFMDLSNETLLQCCNISAWFEYAFAFSTILVNRYRRPYIQRTYKTWITTPIFMMLVSVTLFVLSCVEKPWTTLCIFLVMLLSLPVYYVCLHKRWLSFLPLDKLCLFVMQRLPLVKCEQQSNSYKNSQ